MDEHSAPVRLYVVESKKQIDNVTYKARLDMEMPSENPWMDAAGVDKIKLLVRPLYESARDSLAANSKECGMLKDAFAFWLTSVDDLAPYEAESIEDYGTRLAQRRFHYNVMANRLELGE